MQVAFTPFYVSHQAFQEGLGYMERSISPIFLTQLTTACCCVLCATKKD